MNLNSGKLRLISLCVCHDSCVIITAVICTSKPLGRQRVLESAQYSWV